MQRRSLFKAFGTLTASGLFFPTDVLKALDTNLGNTTAELNLLDPKDNSEEFWMRIRQAYTVSPTIINLNNGGVAPSPKIVQEAVEFYSRMCNELPSYYMWHILDRGREELRKKMAAIAGCSAEEIAFNRNSSEGLETIIFGLKLKRGDEVVLTKQDYPNMINAWKQRAHRDGIVLKWLDFNFPIEDEDIIADTFANAFTSKTKVVHITHMINWNGQLLPVKKIAEKAHKMNIEVVLDAAHTFAHIPYNINDLGCDYFATSLHKWLSAPIGSGMMYVKKSKIKNLYPLFASQDPESELISKFEALGTRSFPIEYGVGHAIEFYNTIGSQKKYDRLYELKEYWVSKVANHPKVRLNSPRLKSFSGAICNISIEGKTAIEFSNFLSENSIHAVAIDWENIHGVRITPNVYTLKSELDRLVECTLKFANK